MEAASSLAEAESIRAAMLPRAGDVGSWGAASACERWKCRRCAGWRGDGRKRAEQRRCILAGWHLHEARAIRATCFDPLPSGIVRSPAVRHSMAATHPHTARAGGGVDAPSTWRNSE